MVLYKHMGDSASFRSGHRQAVGGSGLEFTSNKKTSRFAQYVQQFNQPQPLKPISVQRQVGAGQAMQRVQPVQQTVQPQMYADSFSQQQSLQQPAQQQPIVAPMQQAWQHMGVTEQSQRYYAEEQTSYEDLVQQNMYENYTPKATEQTAAGEELLQTYNFEDNQDSLGMEAPNVDELFGEEVPQAVAYKKVPQSHIVRPALDQKERMSPLKAVFATLGIVVGLGIIGVSTLFICK